MLELESCVVSEQWVEDDEERTADASSGAVWGNGGRVELLEIEAKHQTAEREGTTT